MAVIDQKDYHKILRVYSSLKNSYRDRELKILEYYENATGEMWSPQDKDQLIEQRRPVLEYPLIEPMRNAYVGTERLSRLKMRVVPDTGGAVETAKLLNAAMTWNQNRAWYDFHKSVQFIHTIIGGIGWGHGYWDFAKKRWIFEAFDALRIRWDVRTQKVTFEDCRYMQDTQFLTAEEIEAYADNRDTAKEIRYKFKFTEPKADGNIFYNKLDVGYNWMQDAFDYDYVDSINGRYRVVEHHEKRDVTKVYLVDDNDNIVDATDYEDEETDAFLSKNSGFERFDIPETEYWKSAICPALQMIISNKKYDLESADGFAFTPQLAYNVKPYLKDAYSVLKNPLKINNSFNKRKTVELEYAIKSVGGEFIAESGAIDGHEEDWRTRANKLLRIYNSGFAKPTREAPGQVPAALFQYTNDELTLFDLVGGIGANFRGFKESANETGKLAGMKIRQTATMMQHIFDNSILSSYLDCLNCLKHIQQYMTDEQLINLSEEDLKVIVNENTIYGLRNALNDGGEYSVEIDQTRPSATARQLAFDSVMERVQQFPALAQFLRIDLLWMDSDLPNRKKHAEFARAMYKKMGIDLENYDTLDPTKMNNLLPGSPNQTGMGLNPGGTNIPSAASGMAAEI